MFGSQILDIAIAMVLFYLFISLVCSAVREGLESLTKVRAMNLERGIRELVNDPDGTTIVQQLFNHPQLSGLFQGEYDPAKLKLPTTADVKGVVTRVRNWATRNGNMNQSGRTDLPSYVPASNFAIALMDITANGPLSDNADQPPPPPLTLDSVRASVATLPNSQLQRAMLNAVDRANGDLATAQKNLEDWFNSGMDRVSGWYKRRTQFILFAIGFIAAIALNLDSLAMLRVVSDNKNVRDGLVALADSAKANDNNPKLMNELAGKLQNLGIPLGWENCMARVPPPKPASGAPASARAPQPPACWVDLHPVPQSLKANCDASNHCDYSLDVWGWVKMFFGWVITGAAVTLGAPFWFDLLSKFIQVRSTMKPKAPEATVTDQAATAPAPSPPAPGKVQTQPEPFTPHEWSTDTMRAPLEGVL